MDEENKLPDKIIKDSFDVDMPAYVQIGTRFKPRRRISNIDTVLPEDSIDTPNNQ